MSEYQYVAFRAIDGPLSEKDLKFMRRQSSRAEITRWSFANEYHYGDFRGNAVEMLRRGYDIHLHYANFGIRKLLIRLPHGFPDPRSARPYFDRESIRCLKDSNGPAKTVAIEPFHEPGDLEDLWDIDALVERLIPLRAEILGGDLRPLYLAHLAVSCDGNHDPEETIEAPAPAGLAQPTDAQLALAELYGITPALIAAAARDTPGLTPAEGAPPQPDQWLRNQSEATKNAWLSELMVDPNSSMRTKILNAFRDEQPVQAWPAVQLKRTMAQLHAAANEIQREHDARAAGKAARARASRLAKMALDPATCLRKTEQLVAQRTTAAYGQASELLADLREALADSDQSGLAEAQAQKLKNKHPRLLHLVSALRRKGFLPKSVSPNRKR